MKPVSVPGRYGPGCLLLIVATLAGCAMPAPLPSASAAAPAVSSRLYGDPAHPAQGQGWVRTELYFATGPADQPGRGVDEAGWRRFLDREITPRFPGGLSVFDIQGQWQDPGAPAPERLRSKVVVLLHEANAANDDGIERIRRAWKAYTGDSSVLRVTQPAAVSF